MRHLNSEALTQLETLVDAHGLVAVVEGLEELCRHKAEQAGGVRSLAAPWTASRRALAAALCRLVAHERAQRSRTETFPVARPDGTVRRVTIPED